MVAKGQNCTVKCYDNINAEFPEEVPVDEKYNEIFCAKCPPNLVSQEMVSLMYKFVCL